MIIISSCLAGENCRFDGKNKLNPDLLELVQAGKAKCVCPEVLGGLPTPRDPSEKVGENYLTKAGLDVTQNFIEGALKAWQEVESFSPSKAILKSKSPMCGFTEIYDGTFSGKLVKGQGEFAKLCSQKGLEIEVRD